jgi:SAM-dependent methyltransferase
MRFQWPTDFVRVPDQPWTESPLETLASKYDTVEAHGWYRNLDLTIDQLAGYVRPGQILIDYSGGTGILVDRLLQRVPDLDAGIVIVDSSPKFLRLALEKFDGDERVAFRRLEYLKTERRLQLVEEVLGQLVDRGVDGLVSSNAIHLYYDIPDTLRSWHRVLRHGARVFVQSGNIANPDAPEGDWIIDETVGTIHRTAMAIVLEDDAFATYRGVVGDQERMTKYDDLRNKYFLPVRPLGFYTGALEDAGFRLESVELRSVAARVDEWYDFLSVYHEGVLGWVGGLEKIEGKPATDAAIADRKTLMRAAMDRIFESDEFHACWTYITCRR